MKPTLRKTFSAILIALASLVIVIGIASLAMVQGGKVLLPLKKDTATPTIVTTNPDIVIVKPSTSSSNEATQTGTPSSALVCATPEGWMPIIIMPDQTLDQLAAMYKTTSEKLQQGNCLLVKKVEAGTILFVPASATQGSQSSTTCGAPAGWVFYYVQPGDTLYGIATMFGTTVDQLMYANCLKNGYIAVGQSLYVPPYSIYPIQPLWTPEPTWITFPSLLTPQPPVTLPTGVYYPPP
jgi:LysM repeat protein